MATKEDFNEEQWQLLVDVPSLVGAAVMVAGRSGVGGSMKEAIAMSRNTLKADEPFASNELVKSVLDGRINDKDRAAVEKLSGPYRGLTPDQMLSEATRQCRELVELLQAKTDSAEASQFCEWVQTIGTKVAEAAKEGDFFGFGGERVSDAEEVALQEIAAALKLA